MLSLEQALQRGSSRTQLQTSAPEAATMRSSCERESIPSVSRFISPARERKRSSEMILSTAARTWAGVGVSVRRLSAMAACSPRAETSALSSFGALGGLCAIVCFQIGAIWMGLGERLRLERMGWMGSMEGAESSVQVRACGTGAGDHTGELGSER